jgi:hypothetical protein
VPIQKNRGLKSILANGKEKDLGIGNVVNPTNIPIILQPRDYSAKDLDSWKADTCISTINLQPNP